MKIALVCTNGKVGKPLVAESLAAGFEVTGFARGENKSGAKHFVQKDIFALTESDFEGLMLWWMLSAHGRKQNCQSRKVSRTSLRYTFRHKNTAYYRRRSRLPVRE